MSLGRSAQEWSGIVDEEVVGTDWIFHMAFSNLDDNASDGLTGDTTVEITVTAFAP